MEFTEHFNVLQMVGEQAVAVTNCLHKLSAEKVIGKDFGEDLLRDFDQTCDILGNLVQPANQKEIRYYYSQRLHALRPQHLSSGFLKSPPNLGSFTSQTDHDCARDCKTGNGACAALQTVERFSRWDDESQLFL